MLLWPEAIPSLRHIVVSSTDGVFLLQDEVVSLYLVPPCLVVNVGVPLSAWCKSIQNVVILIGVSAMSSKEKDVSGDVKKDGKLPVEDARPSTFKFVAAKEFLEEEILPRPYICGTFLERQCVSMIVGEPGVGKTSYSVNLGVSVASGADFAGDSVSEPVSVLFINPEDSYDELRRRIKAAVDSLGIESSLIGDRVFLAKIDGSIHLANRVPKIGVNVTAVVAELTRYARSLGAGLIIFDPFSYVHGLDENSNSDMAFVIAQLQHIAKKANCAVMFGHHTVKKSGDARGASSIGAGIRSARSIKQAETKVLEIAGVDNASDQYCAVYDTKSNNSKKSLVPTIFRQSSVTVSGDEVGVLEYVSPDSGDSA